MSQTIKEKMEELRAFERDCRNGTFDRAVRDYNVGSSNYAEMEIQPWDVMESMGILKPYLIGDIIKRVMRLKDGEDKKLDYEKIIHICEKLISIDNS